MSFARKQAREAISPDVNYDKAKPSSTYDLEANEPKLKDVIPSLFGRLRSFPDVLQPIAHSYSTDNSNQITTHYEVACSVGECIVTGIQMDKTPLQEFPNATVSIIEQGNPRLFTDLNNRIIINR